MGWIAGNLPKLLSCDKKVLKYPAVSPKKIGDLMKQKAKIILILMFTVTLINTSVRYMLVEFPNVQESVHLANTQKHVSSVCRVVHASAPECDNKDIFCKSMIYSAITKFIFENTKILTYIWQFPRANILPQSVLLHWGGSIVKTEQMFEVIFPTNRTYIIV